VVRDATRPVTISGGALASVRRARCRRPGRRVARVRGCL